NRRATIKCPHSCTRIRMPKTRAKPTARFRMSMLRLKPFFLQQLVEKTRRVPSLLQEEGFLPTGVGPRKVRSSPALRTTLKDVFQKAFRTLPLPFRRSGLGLPQPGQPLARPLPVLFDALRCPPRAPRPLSQTLRAPCAPAPSRSLPQFQEMGAGARERPR